MPNDRARGVTFSLRVLGGTLGAQWERERRDTLFLMGAIALAVLPHLPFLPLWCSAGFGLLFAWRLGLVFSGHRLPGAAVRFAAGAAATAGVLAQYDTLLGREAGVALLVLFLGLKLMEMRARRDLLVVAFLCFFLLLVGFFGSQSLLTAIVTMLAVVALLTAMLTMQFGEREANVARRLRMVAVMLAQALPIAAALFLLFPRIGEPLWGSPEDHQGGRTGLSETMSPGQISNLADNDDVAFRVEFLDPPPNPMVMYWRGPTLGEYDGRTWRPVRHTVSRPPRPQATLPEGGRTVRYRSTIEPHSRRWLFTLDVPVELPNGPGLAVSIAPEFEVLAGEPLTARVRYEAASRTDARTGLNETRLSLQNWLTLPPGFARRTMEMAARWRSEEPDERKLVERALAMFRDNAFRYTTTPPLLSDDPIDQFLFETRAGFCEHYASAFVVLMRALDIPARVVTGYQGAERHPDGGYWIVRQADAHAWAEVWIAGSGWMRIDPTSAVAPERIERGASAVTERSAVRDTGLAIGRVAAFRRLRLSLDSLAHGWNQWVLGYDRSRQQSLLARVGLDATDPREIAAAIGLVITLGLAAVALSSLRPRAPRDPVQHAYARFCDRLATIGAPRHGNETASRYLHRIDRLLSESDAALARDIVVSYNRLRYDPDTATPERVHELRRLVDAFRPS